MSHKLPPCDHYGCPPTHCKAPGSLSAMPCSEVDEYKVREAQRLIWRNLPGQPSTFGACFRECGGNGRGGGICLKCAQSDLAKLVGDDYAEKYVKAVQAVRNLEGWMLNLPNDALKNGADNQ